MTNADEMSVTSNHSRTIHAVVARIDTADADNWLDAYMTGPNGTALVWTPIIDGVPHRLRLNFFPEECGEARMPTRALARLRIMGGSHASTGAGFERAVVRCEPSPWATAAQA